MRGHRATVVRCAQPPAFVKFHRHPRQDERADLGWHVQLRYIPVLNAAVGCASLRRMTPATKHEIKVKVWCFWLRLRLPGEVWAVSIIVMFYIGCGLPEKLLRMHR